MEEKDSVSIWFVRQALMGLQQRGRPYESLLLDAGIQPGLLRSGQSRVSARSFGALWLAIASVLDDEFFGLDRRRMKVGSFALLCRSTVQAPDLGHALGLAVQYFNILLDDTRLELASDAEDLRILLIDRAGAERPEAFRIYAHETLIIMLHGLLCWLVGRRLNVRSAQFSYARPQWSAEYRSMYSEVLSFGHSQTSICMSAELLSAPVVQSEESAREFLREAPHNFIVKFKDPKSFRARIRQRLRSTPPDEWPKLALLANELGVSTSTLHRKLDAEGINFRQIKDALRRDLAIDRLAHSPESVADIAAELGFAEPSAFHRAFKSWTGLRPGDYRQAES